MSFYITDIHPHDAYSENDLIVGHKVDIDGKIEQRFIRGWFHFYAHMSHERWFEFDAVKLTWEDY